MKPERIRRGFLRSGSVVFLAFFLSALPPGLFPQELVPPGAETDVSRDAPLDTSGGFGFGETAAEGGGFFNIKTSGEIAGRLLVYNRVFSGGEPFSFWEQADLYGKLNAALTSAYVDAFLNLRFNTSRLLRVDEAYGRFNAGPFEAELGLRKLTWGRADSFGPLDVVNPIDYSDLTFMNDTAGMKIARPLVHLSWRFNSLSRLEGVFVPWFRGNDYALEGRWVPSQLGGMAPSLAAGMKAAVPSAPQLIGAIDHWLGEFNIADYYDSRRYSFEYAQGGLRFTTVLGSSDMGFQYYFGRLPRPAYRIDTDTFMNDVMAWQGGLGPLPNPVSIDYNYYHHIGADFARVIAGFNVRLETGANITKDLRGDDGAVYNPSLVYSLGFDRDIIAGINLNLQGNGNVRLMHGKTGDDPRSDIEAGKKTSSTRITAILSRKFFRDELELKATALWGIEDRDFFIMPALVWSKYDLKAELSAGFFGGDRAGELGQYRDNAYVKTAISWSF